MIHITKDQNVAENPNLKVVTPTGDYDDFAHIEVYDISNPEIVSCSFQAQYVVYGGLVYKYNTPQELGVEILKIDPESTHTAASYVRISNQLLEQMNQGSLEIDSLDQVITTEQSKTEEKINENQDVVLEEETVENVPDEVVIEQDMPVLDSEVLGDTETSLPVEGESTIPQEVLLPVDSSEVIPDSSEAIPVENSTVSIRRTKRKIA